MLDLKRKKAKIISLTAKPASATIKINRKLVERAVVLALAMIKVVRMQVLRRSRLIMRSKEVSRGFSSIKTTR